LEVFPKPSKDQKIPDVFNKNEPFTKTTKQLWMKQLPMSSGSFQILPDENPSCSSGGKSTCFGSLGKKKG